MEVVTDLRSLGKKARDASRRLAVLTTEQKNDALHRIADFLEENANQVLKENALDVSKAREKGINEALLDRLTLTQIRIERLVADIRKVTELPDPVGADLESRVLPNGMRLTTPSDSFRRYRCNI